MPAWQPLVNGDGSHLLLHKLDNRSPIYRRLPTSRHLQWSVLSLNLRYYTISTPARTQHVAMPAREFSRRKKRNEISAQ